MDFALILDIIVITILLISAVVAFLRGFVREVLTILGLAGASAAALGAGPLLAPGIEDWLLDGKPTDDPGKFMGFVPYDITASVFAYAGLFVITLIILSILSNWMAKSVHAIGLGAVDRSLGVVFGILRGLVLIGLLYMPFHLLLEQKDKDDWFGEAKSITYVEYTAEIMGALMPESIQRDEKDDNTDEEDSGPLKNLTGEEDSTPDVNLPDTGTDEEAADKEQKNRLQGGEETLKKLMENREEIQKIIQDEVKRLNE